MYVCAFWLAWWILPRLASYRDLKLNREEWTSVVAWGAIGALVGGRVGYAILYEPLYFLSNPFELFALWYGGMSSHGGFVGVVIAIWLVEKRKEGPEGSFRTMYAIFDVITVPAALGLALGRLGNFINQELYDSPIAIMKNLFIALVMYWGLTRWTWLKPGQLAALFLILYGTLRFFTEYVREQEWNLVLGLTRGQWYTIPLIVIGMVMMKHHFLWWWKVIRSAAYQMKQEVRSR